MTIRLDCKFKRVNISRPIEALKCEGDVLLVWWYCGLKKIK